MKPSCQGGSTCILHACVYAYECAVCMKGHEALLSRWVACILHECVFAYECAVCMKGHEALLSRWVCGRLHHECVYMYVCVHVLQKQAQDMQFVRKITYIFESLA